MEYVGIDLHRKYFTYFAADKNGKEISSGKFSNDIYFVEKLTGSFSLPPKVVIEATRNWEWLVRILQEKDCEVVMAHPLKTKAIAATRIKTDSIDAKTLCHLLRSDLIPPSYIASPNEIDNRELSRGRINLVHDRTLLKNRVLAILGKENLNYLGSDMFGVNGRKWLSKQILSETKKCMVEIYLEKINELEKTITNLDELIKQRSSDLPQVKLLESIPGIGTITAFLLAAEIGDIERFNSSKSFASYFGLVPRLNQSGNHAYYGRITKLGNPYVRWCLVQASHRMARIDDQAKRFVTRLAFKGGKKKAIVALARKLSTIIFCILKENRPYIKSYGCPEKSRPAIIPERSR